MPNALRHVVISLGRTPGFTLAAILTLALGTSAVAAAWTIVHDVLLAPLPYADPDRLVSVGLDLHGTGPRQVDQPPALYFTYQRHAQRLRAVGFYRTGNANTWITDGADVPERLTATWVTASTIPLLGVKPSLGRSFTPDEDLPASSGVVILSDGLWRSRFGASPEVLGKRITVNSVVREVVGVMPASFAFPTADTKLWLPSRVDPNAVAVGNFSYSGVGRLAPGASPSEARLELNALVMRVAEWYPQLESGTPTGTWLDDARPTATVVPLRDRMTDGIAGTLWILASAAALVLLVAWGNVVNLMLIRADGRQPELAVREALGASRLRIVTQFLGESLALTTMAGVIALVAAWGAVRALVAFGPADLPRLVEVGVGPATVAVVAVICLVGAIVCGAVPAIRSRRGAVSITLRDGGWGSTAGRTRRRLQASIAVLQIALALAVTTGSALLLRTYYRLYQERPGFDPTGVMTAWTQLPFARYGDSLSVTYHARLTDAIGQLPGVRAVGLTTQLPLGAGETNEESFRVEGDARSMSLPTHVVDDGYFAAMRIPMLAGQTFARLGVQRAGDVVVSARAAAVIWNDPTGKTVIGKRLAIAPSGPWYTVIGVVGDVRDRDLASEPAATIYRPQVVPIDRVVEPGARRTMALVVKTAGGEAAAAIVPEIKRIARDLDPTVPIFNVAPMSDVVRASTARLSLMLTLMGVAAGITLVLGVTGLYGLIGYMVAMRTREFAVRIALGADPDELARAVTLNGLRLMAVGVVGGWLVYGLGTPLLRGYLYGVAPTDPLTLASATVTLVLTALAASWIPARRAARVDPADSLRVE